MNPVKKLPFHNIVSGVQARQNRAGRRAFSI
jgi:hypothetical protein